MSYAGGISFAQLRSAIERGFRPNIRVFLQEIELDGRAGSRVREVKGFTGVSFTRNIGAKGTATITFANIDDRYFQGRGEGPNGRQYSSGNRDLTRSTLEIMLKQALPFIKEINPLRRGSGQDRGFQGVGAYNSERIGAYLDFIYNFTLDRGVKLQKAALKNKGTKNVDLITLGLMQRVFIDVQGQDGLWYAGFSGLVSGVSDDYVPGSVPTITLRCSDLWRLFDLTEITVKQGPGVDNPSDPSVNVRDTIFFDVQDKLGLIADDFRASVFDSTPGQVIVYQILKLTQSALCYIPNLTQLASKLNNPISNSSPVDVDGELELGPELQEIEMIQNEPLIQARRQFFMDDGFWQLPKQDELVANYEGANALRRVHPGINFTRAIERDGTDKRDDDGYKTDKLVYVTPRSINGKAPRKDGEGIQDGDFIGTLTGQYSLDKYVEVGVQGIVYQELIKSIVGPWQVQQASGAAILKKVADATFYDMILNGNGDFVYQVPRYNNHPGEFKAEIVDPRSSPVTTPSQVPDAINSQLVNPPSIEIDVTYPSLTETGLFDYSPGPVRYPTKYHGYNYVITDLGLRRWNLMRSEEPLVTVMRVPGGMNLLSVSNILQNSSFTGRTDLELTRTLQQRFGVRARTSQQIFVPNLFGSRGNARILLDKFAFGLMQQVNGLSDGGTVLLHSRPDLDLGNNLTLVERQKLYYIVGLTFDYKEGDDSSTSFSLSYGHDWGEEIPNPWTLISLDDLVSTDVASREATGVSLPVVTGSTSSSGLSTRITAGTSDTWRNWVWPVPVIPTRGIASHPEISDGFYTPEMRPDKRGGRGHYGVDIFYRRLAGEPGVPNNGAGLRDGATDPTGLAEGTRVKGYFNPDDVPIYAAGPGTVWAVNYSETYGWNITVDHHNVVGFGPTVTFYQHLSSTMVVAGDRVEPGQQIGVIGRPPSEDDSLVHLHFEIYLMRFNSFNRERDAVDPAPIMDLWGTVAVSGTFAGFRIAP